MAKWQRNPGGTLNISGIIDVDTYGIGGASGSNVSHNFVISIIGHRDGRNLGSMGSSRQELPIGEGVIDIELNRDKQLIAGDEIWTAATGISRMNSAEQFTEGERKLIIEHPAELGDRSALDSDEDDQERWLSPEELLDQAAVAIPDVELQNLAREKLYQLTHAYNNKDLGGFMDMVSEDFISIDGKRNSDLETSLITDFDELYSLDMRITTIRQISVTRRSLPQILIVAEWNRTADVEINFQRKRWLFSGRTEFTLNLESDPDELDVGPDGQIDYDTIEWDIKLLKLRGDAFFGLTNLENVLEVVPASPGFRSTLDGEEVMTAVAVGETALITTLNTNTATSTNNTTNTSTKTTTLLSNKTASLESSAAITQSIDFSNGQIFEAIGDPATQGDIFLRGAIGFTFETLGSARIVEVTSISEDDFNGYNKDIEPTGTVVTSASGSIYLVKTREGNFAKILVDDFTEGALTNADITYAYQPDGSGTLMSSD